MNMWTLKLRIQYHLQSLKKKKEYLSVNIISCSKSYSSLLARRAGTAYICFSNETKTGASLYQHQAIFVATAHICLLFVNFSSFRPKGASSTKKFLHFCPWQVMIAKEEPGKLFLLPLQKHSYILTLHTAWKWPLQAPLSPRGKLGTFHISPREEPLRLKPTSPGNDMRSLTVLSPPDSVLRGHRHVPSALLPVPLWKRTAYLCWRALWRRASRDRSGPRGCLDTFSKTLPSFDF